MINGQRTVQLLVNPHRVAPSGPYRRPRHLNCLTTGVPDDESEILRLQADIRELRRNIDEQLKRLKSERDAWAHRTEQLRRATEKMERRAPLLPLRDGSRTIH